MTTTVNQLLNSKTDKIFSVSPDTLVIDAIRMMNEQKVGALLVLDKCKLAGILSERDYTRKVILNNRSSKETPVSEIMTTAVKTVGPSQTVDECMVIMSENHIRHLPVVVDDVAIGVLSIMDVVKNIISEKQMIIDQLEHYITDTAY
ncbi:MAG: CBS domain-containing protein [Proteobacteria bacterium]|nr:CBS domain-containing protein [Pseudomonadota bacterium]